MMSKKFSCKFRMIITLSTICLIFLLLPNISFAAFVDNGDGTVTDTSANLMWKQTTGYWLNETSEGDMSISCQNLVFPVGRYSDWRLPTIDELESLLNPLINKTFFPDTKTDGDYASSSIVYVGPGGTFSVSLSLNFSNGVVRECDTYCPPPGCCPTTVLYTRCVRSAGQSANKFKVWIDKNGNGVYDSGEEVGSASVRVNNETTDRGVTDSQGIIQLQNITNDAKIYAQKILYSMNNPKAGDANFANNRSYNPYYAGSVNGKMYDFVMASDIRVADGSYYDFPGQGKTLQNAAKDSQGNILIQLVHPKIGWNLIVAFEEAQSAAFYDKIRSGFRSYADYMYNYTDGYFVVKNVILVKNAYKDTPQWNYCDVQVKNSEWPNASVFGNRYNYQGHIHMSKEWASAEPDGYSWYSTLGHESGHYLFGFYDEYVNGDYSKGAQFGAWTYRDTHDGDPGEPNEFPKNYGVMNSSYSSHEMSDPTDYFQTYSPSILPDLATAQFARLPSKYIPANEPIERKGKSCWSFFKMFYENDIRTQMAANGLTGFSDAFFNNLIIPPHLTGKYPTSDSTKRNEPSKMNRDTVNFIDWTPGSSRSENNSDENVFDAPVSVTDESGAAVANADVWLVSSDHRSFQGRSDKNGIVKCGSLYIGKRLEAYADGRKAEILIDTTEEQYVLVLPLIKDRRDNTSGIVISAKPDISDSERLNLTISGNALTSAPVVTLSQSFNYSANIAMSASGANQYSGIATCQYNSGNLKVNSGTSQSVSPFQIFSTDSAPASGYYAPNGELEMVYGPNSFTGSGSFVIVNSSAPAPPNGGLIQVGNVYSFGFSDNIGTVKDVTLTVKLPSGGNPSLFKLYGWNLQNKTWNLISGGKADLKYFGISLASLDYAAYALFTALQANDPYPPNPVSGFTASGGTSRWSVRLQWTAPGDNTGVFAYDLRYSTVPVTESNWNSCISVNNPPSPASPGMIQSMILEMPDPNTAYYFGIKAIDGGGNSSTLTTLTSPVRSQAADTDGDGMPDLWEIAHGLNPNLNDAQNDDDGDGLTNLQEYQYHTDPKNKDTDADGYSDKEEITKKTDPTNPDSHPSIAGDLDCDGNVTLTDAIIALRISCSLNAPSTFCFSDVNGDGKIGLEEVIFILQKVAVLR